MNTDTMKAYMVRVLALGCVCGAASFLFVRPVITRASDLQGERQSQLEFIEQGEEHIAQYEDDLRRAVSSTRASRDAMLRDLRSDPDMQDQQLFQRLASARGLTLTRVEPMRSKLADATLGSPEQKAEVERKDYRLECRGSYSGLVQFIDDIQSSNRQMQVISFRLVPTSGQRVKTTLNLSMVELKSYPESLERAFAEGGVQASVTEVME
ncbi:MAG: hypothetical protein ACF8LL_07945 [Phycisphaerales bacterium]